MAPNTLEKLVSDTLYYRRLDPGASCLQHNVAGRELERQSADALPVIEQILWNEVCPVFTGPEESPFHGLSNLLGAYMLLGSKFDAARAVGFLRRLPTGLQAKAAALVPVYFRKNKFRPQERETNDLKTLPDAQLLSFVEELSRSADETVRDKAVRAMSFYDS
jgi:hypothetical protein